jgi:hypothetical protein
VWLGEVLELWDFWFRMLVVEAEVHERMEAILGLNG